MRIMLARGAGAEADDERYTMPVPVRGFCLISGEDAGAPRYGNEVVRTGWRVGVCAVIETERGAGVLCVVEGTPLRGTPERTLRERRCSSPDIRGRSGLLMLPMLLILLADSVGWYAPSRACRMPL